MTIFEQPTAGGAPRILIADGSPASAERLKTLLAGEGFEPEVVFTGLSCLGLFEKRPPDLCLLEASLPDMPGLDVLRRLRSAYPAVPVLICSASVKPAEVVAALRLGAADFVPKPVDGAQLVRQVNDAMQAGWKSREIEVARRKVEDVVSGFKLDDILGQLVLRGGSDLHLKIGRPPLMRLSGDLRSSEFPALTTEDMSRVLLQILGEEGCAALEKQRESDTSYELEGIARFRINAFKRMEQYGIVFRLIPLVLPTIDGMGLPPVLKEICRAPQGLVLLTGPTGSGKSTTMAAMIEYLNETESLHVVTIEDPIEFVYTDRTCTINQRQLGSDVLSLTEALRRVLRQDPDVIMMGEMRDRETIELAMHAAETGHLVFSTLHTNDAKQTLDRVVDMFPSDAHGQVRAILALTLKAVISQRLVKRADGNGRVAAVEVMINSPNIRDLIAEGKTSSIEKSIGSSGDYYQMQTFNQALAKLAMSGTITQEDALASTTNPGDLRLLLKGVTSGSSGGDTSRVHISSVPGTLRPSTPGSGSFPQRR